MGQQREEDGQDQGRDSQEADRKDEGQAQGRDPRAREEEEEELYAFLMVIVEI